MTSSYLYNQSSSVINVNYHSSLCDVSPKVVLHGDMDGPDTEDRIFLEAKVLRNHHPYYMHDYSIQEYPREYPNL